MNHHEFFEAVGMLTVATAILVPFYGTIWELSKAHYLKEQIAKKTAQEIKQ